MSVHITPEALSTLRQLDGAEREARSQLAAAQAARSGYVSGLRDGLGIPVARFLGIDYATGQVQINPDEAPAPNEEEKEV